MKPSRRPGPESRIRRPVFFALLLGTAWFGAVLLAWRTYELPARGLAVLLALAPFVAVLVWSRNHPVS